jgi:hypothetical protein
VAVLIALQSLQYEESFPDFLMVYWSSALGVLQSGQVFVRDEGR